MGLLARGLLALSLDPDLSRPCSFPLSQPPNDLPPLVDKFACVFDEAGVPSKRPTNSSSSFVTSLVAEAEESVALIPEGPTLLTVLVLRPLW